MLSKGDLRTESILLKERRKLINAGVTSVAMLMEKVVYDKIIAFMGQKLSPNNLDF